MNYKNYILFLLVIAFILYALWGNANLSKDKHLVGKIVWAMRVYKHVGRSYFNLWVVNADGTGKRQLTYDKCDSALPKWSPDGQSIAYLRGDGLWLIGADGRGKRRLAVSPEGYLRGVDSSEQGRIIDFAWSPRGDRIAFERSYSYGMVKDIVSGCHISGDKVFWVTLKDGKVREAGRGLDPHWQPDGRRLVWRELKDIEETCYLIDTITGKRKEVEEVPKEELIPSTLWVTEEKCSPNGRLVAEVQPWDLGHQDRLKLIINRIDNKQVRTIPLDINFVGPAWLEGWLWDNRRALVGVSQGSSGGADYYLVDTQTGKYRKVLNQGGAFGVRAAVWSPGYRYVLVATCDAFVRRFGKIRVYHNRLEMRRVDGLVVRRYTVPVSISWGADWYIKKR